MDFTIVFIPLIHRITDLLRTNQYDRKPKQLMQTQWAY
jgi:hypothetical protein